MASSYDWQVAILTRTVSLVYKTHYKKEFVLNLTLYFFHFLEEFKFISKPWMIVPIAFKQTTGNDLLIDCVTTESKALVTLQVRLKKDSTNVVVDGSKLFGDRLVNQVICGFMYLILIRLAK